MRSKQANWRAAILGLGAVLLFLPMRSARVVAQDGHAAGSDCPAGNLFGNSMPGPDRPGPGGPGGPGDHGPLSGLARAEADEAATEVIAELTKVPASDVARVIRTWDVPLALRYFDVDRKAFHDAFTERLSTIVQAAVQAHYVPAREGDRIVGDLGREPPPPPHPND